MAPPSFLGRGWSFPPAFDAATRDVRMSEGEEDIRESLRILFTTALGERVMRADYGSGLERHVFARRDATVVNMLKGSIRNAIVRFEPRIVVEDVHVDPDGLLDGRLLFDVRYRISATNTRSNMVFPYYLGEGTNVSAT